MEARNDFIKSMVRETLDKDQVAGLANWGVSEGLVYERFIEQNFDFAEEKSKPGAEVVFGLDFGYVQDPTALFCGIINTKEKRIYVFDEIYQKGLSNEKIYLEIARKGYMKEKIIADCAEPKSIDRLYDLGLSRIRASRKGADSVLNGIDFIQDYEIIISPRCKNFLLEINNYVWQDSKTGEKINKPIDEYNHLMDAMRYSVEDFIRGRKISFFS